MINLPTPSDIQKYLHKELENLGNFEECALLDYPNHPNLGDHLIWLGTVFYLTDIVKAKINYAADINQFSADEMEKKVNPEAPIICQGGGNIGDLWPKMQEFREYIISKYKDRKIIILPQTIQFNNLENLKRAANIFNSHRDLTIFTRENTSYEIAKDYFHKCHILKAPDMAFHLVNMPYLSPPITPKKDFLYHCRSDFEPFPLTAINLPNVEQSDWVSAKWIFRNRLWSLPKLYGKKLYEKIPGIATLFREGWQRGLSHPGEWLSRQWWDNFHPNVNKFKKLANPPIHRKSWSYMHTAIHQLKQYHFIITNRTHGHISCILLDIPHIFAPGSYHKNQSMYETWTNQIPFCRWVTDASKIQDTAQELLELYPKHTAEKQT